MRRRLPPLNALRAFEAAARHGGFVGAAEELAVTPAAVSHQIKALEEVLEVPLFVRLHRAVELTSAGQALLPGLSDAFDRLATTIDDVMRQVKDDRPLTISAPPSFAAKWLMPRLERFLSLFPDSPVRIEAEPRVVDLRREEADMAIRLTPRPTDLESIPLFCERLFPVCAPVLRMALTAPANLTRQTLIYDDLFEKVYPGQGWQAWLEKAGVPTLKPAKAMTYSHTSLSLDAAVRGMGVALGRGALVEAELRAGSLVKPFQTAASSPTGYCLVWVPERPLRPEAEAFRDWLSKEAADFCTANPTLIA
jgi:DNA-binding transcriptional LysR family regulator